MDRFGDGAGDLLIMRRFASTVLWLALVFVLVLSRADASHRLSLFIAQFPALTGGDCATTAGSGSILCGTVFARTSNNLSDLASASTARTNLGLGTAATANIGTSGATVPLLSTANTWASNQTIGTAGFGSTSVTTGFGCDAGNCVIRLPTSTGGFLLQNLSGGTTYAGANSTAFTTYVTLNASTSLAVGSTVPTLSTNELGLTKMTASGTAPGAGTGKLALVAGTNAGTCKLIVYAGTSTIPSTIFDNIGAGC